jgi:hypothetical protein
LMVRVSLHALVHQSKHLQILRAVGQGLLINPNLPVDLLLTFDLVCSGVTRFLFAHQLFAQCGGDF